jgi:hypothetical protein
MKIGSHTVNLLVFYKHDEKTSNNMLNLSKYNKDASSEAAHFTWGALGGEKGMEQTSVEWTEFTCRLITCV